MTRAMKPNRVRPAWRGAYACAMVGLVTAYAATPATGGRGSGFDNVPLRTSAPAAIALHVVAAQTPLFPVARYDTHGTYPRVTSSAIDTRRANSGLREALIADQDAYEPAARQHSAGTSKAYRGLYATTINRELVSASSVVVSALLPAIKLYPGGNEGQTWVALNVDTASGKRISISSMFADPTRGITVLAAAWKAAVKRQRPLVWKRCIAPFANSYSASPGHYRMFALTTKGMAVGFPQAPACSRVVALVPYSQLRRVLSERGKLLVAGVRVPAR